jgi:hypothetical protein
LTVTPRSWDTFRLRTFWTRRILSGGGPEGGLENVRVGGGWFFAPFPITWNHLIEMELLNTKKLERILIEKV